MKMCQALGSQGHDVVLVAPDFDEQYETNINTDYDFYKVEQNFKIMKLKVPKMKGRIFLYALQTLFFMIKNKSDLVYSRFILSSYLAVLIGKNVVFESHSSIYSDNKLTQNIFKRLIKNKYFLKLVVISEKLKEVYLHNNISNDKIYVAHDGADEVKNKDLNIPLQGTNELNIGYIGHLYEGKGMEVIEGIASKLSHCSFHIVGGTPKDIAYWSQKITVPNVYFYGFVTQDKVQKYINSMDICLLPNQKVVHTHGSLKQNISEYTSPLKMFEYMASKKAIIASDLPVLREVLNENNSLLVQCDDYEKWIEAVLKLTDRSLREKIATEAHKDFKESFTWKQRAKNILKVI